MSGRPWRLGERFGAEADKVNVGALVEDEPSGLDGIAEALHAGHAAGAQGGAVHQERVELHAAIAGEEAAASGVEGGIVFEDGDGSLDRIERAAAAFEDLPAFLERIEDALLVGFELVGGDVPRAAVNEKNRGSSHRVTKDCILLRRWVSAQGLDAAGGDAEAHPAAALRR